MSRHQAFSWEAGPRTPELRDLWDALLDGSRKHCGHEALFPCRESQGGSSVPEGVSVYLWCNRSKVRRIAARLDDYFGVRGRLLLLLPDHDVEIQR